AASDQRNPIAPSHRSHWSNSKRFFESDLLAARKGYFSRCPNILNLDIKTSGQLKNEEYQGVLQEQLSATLAHAADC
ncbi:MAG: hypothetical protein ACR2KT_13255, partial [Methylocella sp.]